jgi:S-adenosylmethionine-diacylglycerol 3-amino-3-carboxypropyl transferase
MEGLLERAFTMAFSSLVYAQIWEDPVVDLEALEIRSDSRLVAIASGGCNVLSYLTADPAAIFAVDLNAAHVALNRLKICAIRKLPSHAAFVRFFGNAADACNIAAYDRYVRPHLDATSRRYWDRRDALGRRRVARFKRGFYRTGLLGRFIGVAHFAARLHGRNPARMLAATTLEEQREIFLHELAPLFDAPAIRYVLDHRISLYGLGIPPAQYEALQARRSRMSQVLRDRLEHLACSFPIADNYFAWQAFARRYGEDEAAPLPPYLQRRNFEAVRIRADRVEVHQASITDFLIRQPAASLDRFVLLDAQDWMSAPALQALWTEIARTARPGARVVFRTAARESLLPGRLPEELLARWQYEERRSEQLGRRDRSAIYGGFHIYALRGGRS